MTALANNVYQAMLRYFQETFPELKISNIRLKTFRERFILVVYKFFSDAWHFKEGGTNFKIV
jgi:hypothetical protein